MQTEDRNPAVPSWRSRYWLRWLLLVVVAVGLTAWVFRTFGDLGFNPTDEGYVLAQAYRVLHGAVPHRDFISPRPLGSAYLHVLDFAVPLPLMPASRLVAAAQVTLYSLLLATLVFERSPGRWSVAQFVAAASSVLVNLHAFPLMAWATIDGLVMVAAGFALLGDGLGRDRGARIFLGLAFVGAATLMKQSFVTVASGALLWIAVDGHRRGVVPVSRLVAGAAVLAAPMTAYAAAVALAGGFGAMRLQLGSAAPPLTWCALPDVGSLPGLVVFGATFVALRVVEGRDARAVARWNLAALATITLAAMGSARVVSVALGDRLAYANAWGLRLFWMLALAVAIDACTTFAVDAPAVVVLVIAWASTLSWGYAVPNLLGGTIALALLRLLWRGLLAARPSGSWWGGLVAGAAAVAGMVMVVQTIGPARTWTGYFDAPLYALRSFPGNAIPALGRIRTSKRTATYLRQLVSCLQQFPARRIAVIPDNPFLYPAMGIPNPLPIDWLYPPEIRGSEERLREAARRLEREGDYLVLVQGVDGYQIAYHDLPQEIVATSALGAPQSPVREITSILTGTWTVCGSFVAIHAAPAE
jgi:hypothetical protein